MKIGEVCWMVVDKHGGFRGYGYDYDEAVEQAKREDVMWPPAKPHRVARVRLVEVKEDGDE